jgi:predicted N-acetyltransferase YhbS
VTPIRPLERDDLPAVAALYAEFVGWDPVQTVPGLSDFFARVLLDHPFADAEIPALVYEDADDGVVGVMGSHARPFHFRDRTVRLGFTGPLIVAPAHRPRGIGALLLRRYVAGPQDMTANDRVLDQVHDMWERLGGVTDTGRSIGWAYTLGPAGLAASAVARRASRHERAPGGALLAGVDRLAARRRVPQPATGTGAPLTDEALLDLLDRLKRPYPLRPAFDADFLAFLRREMDLVNVGERVARRLIVGDDGKPLGAYVMYVTPGWLAEVVAIVAAPDNTGLVLDHLLRDAAAAGAVEVRGRFEPQLLPYLRTRRLRFTHTDWTMVQSKDPELVATALSGRALLGRLDGEWWMRPREAVVSQPTA